MSISRGAAKVVAATATLALTFSLPADANVRRFSDAHNDTSSSVDIWSVRVDNSTTNRSKVIVVVRQDNVRLGDSIHVHIDTRKADRGPEYVIEGTASSEFFMYHQERWKDRGRPVPFRCGYRLTIKEDADRSRAAIPRKCLGFPGKVRVAVKADRGFPPTSRDWAPARRTWFRSVAR